MHWEENLFPVIYGRGLAREMDRIAAPPYLVVTMAEIWPRLQTHFPSRAAQPFFVSSVQWDVLYSATQSLPPVRAIVGAGGGAAMDAAKFFAWMRGLPLYQLPTILSADAAFGHRAAVRHNRRVEYVGWAVPEAVFLDFDLIRSAPPGMNRAGASNALAIHTALFDWDLATRRGLAGNWTWDPALAERAREFLEELRKHLGEIRAVSESGIRALAEALRWTGGIVACIGWNPRPVEGSEHLFFYALEALTGRSYLHGEAVGLGIALMAMLQENEPDRILGDLKAAGLRVHPAWFGVTWPTVREVMAKLRGYCQRENMLYSILHEADITEKFLNEAEQKISALFPPP
jgi:glycerol dehydrogenase-like iron-containing ADH family enzyme